MKYLLTILVFCSSVSLFAQEIGEDVMINQSVLGYIVGNKQDTTWGRVVIATRTKNQVKVKFTPQNDLKAMNIKSKDEDIIAYGFRTKQNNGATQTVDRWRHYVRREADQPPMPFTTKDVFMEVKAAGSVNLYSYYVESNTQVDNSYLHYYFMEAKYSKDSDEKRTRKVTKENFELMTSSFTEDCQKVQNMIGSAYDYSNLAIIVENYNECETARLLAKKCEECKEEAARKEKERVRLEQEQRANTQNKEQR